MPTPNSNETESHYIEAKDGSQAAAMCHSLYKNHHHNKKSMKREKEIKSFNLELKDLNDSTGEVSFYFAAFTKDLMNDTISSNAYAKTLSDNAKNNYKNIYHNRDHQDACGVPFNFGVDSKGVYCTSKLALKTVVGNDVYEQYKAGIIKGHSQEFEVMLFDQDAKGGRFIKEMKLYGVTSVTNIPANLNTPTISIKSFNDMAIQMKSINDILHNGNISDELGNNFCMEYKKLLQFMQNKSQMLKDAGVVICDNCKSIIFDDAQGDGVEENPGTSKCANCGRYVNKSGNLKPYRLLSPESVKNFQLVEKK